VIYEAGAVVGDYEDMPTDGWMKQVSSKKGKKTNKNAGKMDRKSSAIKTTNMMAQTLEGVDDEPSAEVVVDEPKPKVKQAPPKVKRIRQNVDACGKLVTREVAQSWLQQADTVKAMGEASQLSVIEAALHDAFLNADGKWKAKVEDSAGPRLMAHVLIQGVMDLLTTFVATLEEGVLAAALTRSLGQLFSPFTAASNTEQYHEATGAAVFAHLLLRAAPHLLLLSSVKSPFFKPGSDRKFRAGAWPTFVFAFRQLTTPETSQVGLRFFSEVLFPMIKEGNSSKEGATKEVCFRLVQDILEREGNRDFLEDLEETPDGQIDVEVLVYLLESKDKVLGKIRASILDSLQAVTVGRSGASAYISQLLALVARTQPSSGGYNAHATAARFLAAACLIDQCFDDLSNWEFSETPVALTVALNELWESSDNYTVETLEAAKHWLVSLDCGNGPVEAKNLVLKVEKSLKQARRSEFSCSTFAMPVLVSIAAIVCYVN